MVSIGEVSRQTGVNIETIRYYERIGLVSPPPRTANGRRAYAPSHVNHLSFIKHARDLGFDIATIKGLLEMQHAPNASCAAIAGIAKDHLAAVKSRIAALHSMQRELERMIGRCRSRKVGDCRIIEALTAPFVSGNQRQGRGGSLDVR